MTQIRRISPQALGPGDSMPATLLSDSWTTGWRSALLREYDSHASVEELCLPALPEQLLVLTLSGTKVMESFDGARWRRARRGSGDLAMTAPGETTRVRWRVEGSTPARSLHLHLPGAAMRDAVRDVWGEDSERFVFPDALRTGDPVVRQVLLTLRDAHRRGLSDLYVEAAVAFLAVHLVSSRLALRPPPARRLGDLHADRAKQFMTENIGTRLTVADVAAQVNLSVFHFCRSFREATGSPPRTWLAQRRLEMARSRLRRSSDSVQQIARDLGFNSPSHFSSCFVRSFGVTPSAFRRDGRAVRPDRTAAEPDSAGQRPRSSTRPRR